MKKKQKNEVIEEKKELDKREFHSDITKIKDFLDDATKEDAVKDVLDMTEEESLKFKNFNLQVLLADKNIENLQLRVSIIEEEKKSIMENVALLKSDIQNKHGIKNIDDYVIDVSSKKIIHRRLLQK